MNSLKSTASSIAICLTLLGPASFGLLASARAAEPAKRPNILYIMTDDHAAHAMSCYGSKVNKTPNLDRIAEQGVRFKLLRNNSICTPARACILPQVQPITACRVQPRRRWGRPSQILQEGLLHPGRSAPAHPTAFDHGICPQRLQGPQLRPNPPPPSEAATDVHTDLASSFPEPPKTTLPAHVHHKPHRPDDERHRRFETARSRREPAPITPPHDASRKRERVSTPAAAT